MRTFAGLLMVAAIGLASARVDAQVLGDENLPSLFKAVKPSADPVVRATAIMQLAQFGAKGAPAVPDLIDALKSKQEDVRVAAAFTLAAIGEASIEPVAKLIKSQDADTRYYAAWTLGLIGKDARDTLPAVIGAMSDKDANVRRKAAFALGRIGGDAGKTMAALAGAFSDENDDVRESAADALARLGKPAVPTLVKLLKSDSPFVFWHAAASLAIIGPDAADAVPAFRDRLLAKDADHVKAFAHALAKIGTKSLPALQAGFRDSREVVRAAAAEGLEQLGGEAVPFLLETLRDKNVAHRRQAVQSLFRIKSGDRQVVLALVAGLQDEDHLVRFFCVHTLEVLGPQATPVLDKLQAMLIDPYPNVRGQAAHMLHVREVNVDDILVRNLESKDTKTRLISATLMMERNLNDNRPVPILTKGLDHDDLGLRVQAAFGLAWRPLERERIFPIFVSGLKHKDSTIRLQAATGLRMVGEARGGGASEALAEVLNDPEPEVRFMAAWALRLVSVDVRTTGPIIVRQFKNGDAGTRIAILGIDSNRLGDLTKELRTEGIKDKDLTVRDAVVAALEKEAMYTGAVNLLPELETLMKDKNVDIRLKIAPLLQRAGEKGVPLLSAMLLKDADARVRMNACITISAMRDLAKKAVPALEAALKDPDHQIRQSAVHTIVQVGGLKAALPALRIAANDEHGYVRVTALHTLVHAGGEKPATLVNGLIECMKDRDGGVRQTAITALHFLGADAAPALPLMRELAKNDPDATVRNIADNSARYIEGMIKK